MLLPFICNVLLSPTDTDLIEETSSSAWMVNIDDKFDVDDARITTKMTVERDLLVNFPSISDIDDDKNLMLSLAVGSPTSAPCGNYQLIQTLNFAASPSSYPTVWNVAISGKTMVYGVPISSK